MEMRLIQFLGGNYGDTEIVLGGWIKRFHIQNAWDVGQRNGMQIYMCYW